MNPASLILLRIFRVRSWQKLLFSFHTWEHKLGAWGTPDTQSASVKMKIQSQICAARFMPSWPECPGGAKVVGKRTPNRASPAYLVSLRVFCTCRPHPAPAPSPVYLRRMETGKIARLDWLSCQWLLHSAHPVITAIHFPKTLPSSFN